MHVFLLIAVLIEAVAIGYLLWSVHSQKIGIESLSDRLDSELERLVQAENQISLLVADVREFLKVRDADSKELGERITQIANEQEKIRRNAARPGAAGYSFESIRNRAEQFSMKRDAEHDKLVSLAEG
ncbi:MAG TPA: hypothetical protein VFO86_09030 [Terriglobia bacterium]|nr:hypothetical protein [Terriglobia bacterium]